MATSTSARFSTYSGASSLQPSLAPTTGTTNNCTNPNNPNTNTTNSKDARLSQATTLNHNPNTRASMLYTSHPLVLHPNSSTPSLSPEHPKSQDIQSWTGTLSRLQDARLEKQRYVMSNGKNEEVSKLALGAKVERALGRRLVGQDAVFSASSSAGSATAGKDGEVLDEKKMVEV